MKILKHCMKSVQIRSFSGPYFPVFEMSADQKNSVFRQFSRSEVAEIALKFLTDCKSLLSPK